MKSLTLTPAQENEKKQQRQDINLLNRFNSQLTQTKSHFPSQQPNLFQEHLLHQKNFLETPKSLFNINSNSLLSQETQEISSSFDHMKDDNVVPEAIIENQSSLFDSTPFTPSLIQENPFDISLKPSSHLQAHKLVEPATSSQASLRRVETDSSWLNEIIMDEEFNALVGGGGGSAASKSDSPTNSTPNLNEEQKRSLGEKDLLEENSDNFSREDSREPSCDERRNSKQFTNEEERQKYLKRRASNNIAAKNSRRKKQEREEENQVHLRQLVEENKRLKEDLLKFQTEVLVTRQTLNLFIQSVAMTNPNLLVGQVGQVNTTGPLDSKSPNLAPNPNTATPAITTSSTSTNTATSNSGKNSPKSSLKNQTS